MTHLIMYKFNSSSVQNCDINIRQYWVPFGYCVQLLFKVLYVMDNVHPASIFVPE